MALNESCSLCTAPHHSHSLAPRHLAITSQVSSCLRPSINQFRQIGGSTISGLSIPEKILQRWSKWIRFKSSNHQNQIQLIRIRCRWQAERWKTWRRFLRHCYFNIEQKKSTAKRQQGKYYRNTPREKRSVWEKSWRKASLREFLILNLVVLGRGLNWNNPF